MGIDKRQRWVLGILGIVLVTVWIRAFTFGPVHSARRSGQKVPSSLQLPEVAPSVPAISTSSTDTSSEGWGDSPFLMERGQHQAGGPSSEATPEEYLLNGILWDPQAPSAIVNNRVVNMGDQIGPWRVVEIQKDRVILSNGTQTRTLQTE